METKKGRQQESTKESKKGSKMETKKGRKSETKRDDMSYILLFFDMFRRIQKYMLTNIQKL